MSILLIAENILKSSHFLSATSQAGEKVGQPIPGSANTGKFRLLANEDYDDFSYSGTATTNGSTTTIVDSNLTIYGDDYFIGATITFTDGANTSGTKTVTDFAQATGTLTWSGALNSTTAGDTYTLTRNLADCDFHIELTGSGDTGDATFKWSHDGGTTFFGRDSPNQATWLNVKTLADNVKALSGVAIIETSDHDLVFMYQDEADDYAKCIKSTDGGVTWGSAVSITAVACQVKDAVCLKYGTNKDRIIMAGYTTTHNLYYSDDEGATWATLYSNFGYECYALSERRNGTLLMLFYDATNYIVYISVSLDSGKSWSTSGAILDDTSAFYGADVIELDNGDLYAAISTDAYHAGDFEIQGYTSSNGGVTWSKTGTDIPLYEAAHDYYYPRLLLDTDGAILAAGCCLTHDAIHVARSTDRGTTFSAAVIAVADTINDPRRIDITHWRGSHVIIVMQGEVAAGAELIANGGMETVTAGVTLANWTAVGTPATFERSNTVAYAGTYSAKFIPDALNEGFISDHFATVTGTTYKVVVNAYRAVSGPDHFSINMIQGNDSTTVVYSRDCPCPSTATWYTFTFYYSETSGGASAHLRIITFDASGTIYFDGVSVTATGGIAQSMRRGGWELYAAGTNDAPCAIWGMEQELICNARIIWHGYGGIDGDTWTMQAAYDYAMANLIKASPSVPWRSTTDNSTCTIVNDMSTNVRHYADAVAYFGSNLSSVTFQMDVSSSFNSTGGNPVVNQGISFDLATGSVDAIAGNMIQDTSLTASYKDHQLSDNYLRMTAGTDNGVAWRIKDNVGSWITLDSEVSNGIATANTFSIYGNAVTKTFTPGTPYVFRYFRHTIAAQQTPNDYYQIGYAMVGRAITLTRGYRVGAQTDYQYAIEYLRNRGGNIQEIKTGERRRTWRLDWIGPQADLNEVISLMDYIDGKNICLVPDSTVLTACYLVKATSSPTLKHVDANVYELGPVILEEIL